MVQLLAFIFTVPGWKDEIEKEENEGNVIENMLKLLGESSPEINSTSFDPHRLGEGEARNRNFNKSN